MKSLKAFRVRVVGMDEMNYVIVAQTAPKAKNIALASDEFEDIEYRELRVRKITCVSDLPEGIVDYIECLKRGWYDIVDDYCPICKHEALIYYRNGVIGCEDCLAEKEDLL
jgi:hypothetical protein